MTALQGYVITTTYRAKCVDVVIYSVFLFSKIKIKWQNLYYKLVD